MILALVYGYIPYFILPVFAGLDRIDRQPDRGRARPRRDAVAGLPARDAAAQPAEHARRRALVVLPMFGDYYTNDLISASPRTNMLGNEINLFVQGGPEKNLGASLVLVLMAILLVGDGLLRDTQTARDARRLRDARRHERASRRRRRLRNPWGRPRFLVAVTWVYIAVGAAAGGGRDAVLVQRRPLAQRLAGVLDALVVGRSERCRSSTTPTTRTRSSHSLRSPALDMVIATPLGVLLALGLARWRGRGSGVANGLMLVPLVTPEIVMAVSLLLVFTQLSIVPFSLIHLGTTAPRSSARSRSRCPTSS